VAWRSGKLDSASDGLALAVHVRVRVSAAKYRGGRGTVFEFELLRPNCQIIARNRSRLQFPAWGRLEGEPGGQSRVWLNPGTERECMYDVLQDVLELEQGEVLRFVSACGGAYGDPLEREPALVLRDVEEGVLSIEAAEADFGVVIDNRAVAVDRTTELRTVLKNMRAPLPAFSYGVERAFFETGGEVISSRG